MAQVTETVARGILAGHGYTDNEVRQLAHHWLASHGQAPASVLHLVNSAFAEIAMAFPKAFALHKVGIADTAVREALTAPVPPQWGQPVVAGDVDRADAVNLARNALTQYDCAITKKGVRVLAEAVLSMDSALTTPQPAQAQAGAVPLDEARRLFYAGWKAAALLCDREDVVADGIIGFGACPQFEAAFSAANGINKGGQHD